MGDRFTLLGCCVWLCARCTATHTHVPKVHRLTFTVSICVMCVLLAKQSPERERNTLTAYSYWRARALTFRQDSLVIGNFNDYYPLLAFDS